MKRHIIDPRNHWEKLVANDGFIWHTANGKPYWQENAYYSFTLAQVEEIEKATEHCHIMMMKAAEHVIENKLFDKFQIPEAFIPRIIADWKDEPPALNYGRFDFGYDGKSPPKLFEYNADTPTSLVEAAVIQWNWKEDVFAGADQFNSIHERFIARWKEIAPHLPSKMVYFTHGEETSGEDAITTAYMMDLAHEGGIIPEYIPIEQIGYDKLIDEFVDKNENEIEALYKLYPWEWLVNEEFGENILKSSNVWIEPSWKMLLSNKAILPFLWELFPESPYLLPTVFGKGAPKWTDSYVVKPILAREGANVTIMKDGAEVAKTEGVYEKSEVINQALYPLPNFSGKYPVIGSWCVDGEACGMGIREDGLITGNTASFIPHIIEG